MSISFGWERRKGRYGLFVSGWTRGVQVKL